MTYLITYVAFEAVSKVHNWIPNTKKNNRSKQ